MSLTVKAQRTIGRASVAMTVAALLLLQVVFVGLAAGSAIGGTDGALFGVTCASQQLGDVDDGAPAAPATKHQHGLCCILHDGALAATVVRHVFGVVVAHSETAPQPSPGYSVDAIRLAPELAPLSPRAPPSLPV